MNIITYQYKASQAFECPFNKRYFDDYWIAYHGTSNIVEKDIDKIGLLSVKPGFSQEDVKELLDIFKKLLWFGRQLGGFFVLSQYAAKDFNRPALKQEKPVFLAESSFSGLLYSSPDFAGGETARAIRYAFEDLNRFLEDDGFRISEQKKIFNSMKSISPFNLPNHLDLDEHDHIEPGHIVELWNILKKRGKVYPAGLICPEEDIKPVEFSKDWLKEQLYKLEPIYRRSLEYKEKYKYGVIYVVKFTKKDLSHINYDSNHGLISYKPIEPNKFIEKAHIYFDDDYLNISQDDIERINKMLCNKGIYKNNRP